jgi:predicted phosphoribosyltransferase
VAPPDTVKKLENIADKVVCLRQPHDLRSIGQFYDDFTQVPSQEAKRILASLHPGTE